MLGLYLLKIQFGPDKNISIVDGNVTGFDGVGGLLELWNLILSLKNSSFEGSVNALSK